MLFINFLSALAVGESRDRNDGSNSTVCLEGR
jgi:hypothetical protein